MGKERFVPFVKEFIFVALLLCAINAIVIFSEDILLLKSSRFCTSFLLTGYLIVKHKIYTKTGFFIGFIGIVSIDFFLIYYDYFISSLLVGLLILVVFRFFLWNIIKSINWKKTTFSNIIILSLSILPEVLLSDLYFQTNK